MSDKLFIFNNHEILNSANQVFKRQNLMLLFKETANYSGTSDKSNPFITKSMA